MLPRTRNLKAKELELLRRLRKQAADVIWPPIRRQRPVELASLLAQVKKTLHHLNAIDNATPQEKRQ